MFPLVFEDPFNPLPIFIYIHTLAPPKPGKPGKKALEDCSKDPKQQNKMLLLSNDIINILYSEKGRIVAIKI